MPINNLSEIEFRFLDNIELHEQPLRGVILFNAPIYEECCLPVCCLLLYMDCAHKRILVCCPH